MDDGLEEPQVLHMLPVALDAVDEVLNHFLVDFIAQHCIVLMWYDFSDQDQYIGVSVDNRSLAWNIAHIVFAWSRSGLRKSSRCL